MSLQWTLSSLLLCLLLATNALALDRVHEFQRYDGWFNNLANPEWGSVGSRLHRHVPSDYYDGVYMMDDHRPSARAISDLVFKGPSGLANPRNATTMLAFFSQVVAYEILQATQISCPLEMHKIPVTKCDPVFDRDCEGQTMIPFTRAKYDMDTGRGFNVPREQLNDKTSWIDASFLYSTQEPWVAELRSWENGTLSEGPMPGYPPFNANRIPLINPPPPQIHRLMDPERLYLLGDPRINENPGLLSFGLILFRWHNLQAKQMRVTHPTWTDEELFQGARRWVIASLQKIIMYDFLPAMLNEHNPLPTYTRYKPDVPPGISNVFAAAAFRFPHSMVPPGMLLRMRTKGKCTFRSEVGGYPALRMCQNWWNAQDIVQEYSVDEIVLGMASQIAETEDSIIIDDLRDFLFGPMWFTRLDLAAIGIMRGRDNGVPRYNDVRRSFGLPPRNWSEINPKRFKEEPEMFAQLMKLFDYDVGKLDLYVGGMMEAPGDRPGELFSKIIKDQFQRIRDSDRFWYENRLNGLFTDEELEAINNITLYDIIRQTTDIGDDELQKNLFFWREGDPCGQPFQVNTTGMEACIPFMRFDHFMGNEFTYIFTCIGLATIPIICIGIGYWLIQRRKRMGGEFVLETCHKHKKKSQENNNNIMNVFSVEKDSSKVKDKRFKINAIEWLHENYCRSVTVCVEPTPALRLEKPRGGLLRLIDLADVRTLVATVSDMSMRTGSGGPFVLLTLLKDHDMVLRFDDQADCDRFMRALESALKHDNRHMSVRHAPNDIILGAAETLQKRQSKLDHFFREAYSKAFNMPSMHDSTKTYDAPVSEQVLSTTVTRAEFADALGMRETDLFVERMFACVARRHTDKICFQEFLQVVARFSNGSLKEKLDLVFEMCDRDGRGTVDRAEFCTFVRSLKLAAGVSIESQLQDTVIEQMLTRAGVAADKTSITRKDFEAIFGNVHDVGVHMRGARLKINLQETESLNSFAVPSDEWTCWRSNWISKAVSLLEDYRQHIAILTIFFLFTGLFFLERFWHYRYESEHRDLRRVMGVGIAVTRGAAASMSFCFGLILLTVCRNVMTLLRETPLMHYIPFDSAITFHKIIAIVAGVFAAIHSIGHCINFYHVATQSKEGLQCLFQEAVFGSNFQPSISYWFYGTITGVTGIMLVVVMSIIYVFAAPAVLKQAYHAFHLTHFLNILLYVLIVAHGLPKLLDTPKFIYFVAGPLVIFIIDRILGMRQNYRQLQIVSAALLPSDIIHIEFKRPRHFRFRSGQWVRISCPAFSCNFNERHAFSVASAPQQTSLEMYIKAVGPWTWKLRHHIGCAQANGEDFPMLHMNGPYGDGNQEWSSHEVAVLVGGGIGVTPYASILSDLVEATSSGKHTEIKCKKVYFLWICPTHKNFEWFIDVLRNVEDKDVNGVLEIHIFVTQFFHKFDLRTTMLYICEKHFRGDRGRSMFTNLKGVNHFGRPNFGAFLKYVQKKHKEQDDIGVFSCGPALLNKEVRQSCIEANRSRDEPHYVHKYETF